MAKRILDLRPDLHSDSVNASPSARTIYFAHCPERILPGKAMEELRSNDRIIGGMSPEATRRAKEIYSSFCDGELLESNDRTAELAKLTENSFRDVNIAFANELSLICDQLEIDVWELIELANHHPRVNILQPGPGVGGHCIAVDPWFIVSSAPDTAKLIHLSREVNDGKPKWVLQKIQGEVSDLDKCAKIALFGLAFKPDIDDLRESPALEIAREVAESETERDVLLVEPNITELPPQMKGFQNVSLTTVDEALEQAEVIALLVDHSQFKDIPAHLIEGKRVIDTKGVWRR